MVKLSIHIEMLKAYIPDNVPQGFVSSHSIGNYKWIFNKLIEGNRGYVTPRK